MHLVFVLLVAFVSPVTPKIPIRSYLAVVTGELACPPPPPGTIDKTAVNAQASLEYSDYKGVRVVANASELGRRHFSLAGDYAAPSFHSLRLRVSGYRCGTKIIEHLKPTYSERLPNDPEDRTLQVYSLGDIEMTGYRN